MAIKRYTHIQQNVWDSETSSPKTVLLTGLPGEDQGCGGDGGVWGGGGGRGRDEAISKLKAAGAKHALPR